MASWISKAWIEQALIASKEDLLPKIAKAQILKVNFSYVLRTNFVERLKSYEPRVVTTKSMNDGGRIHLVIDESFLVLF